MSLSKNVKECQREGLVYGREVDSIGKLRFRIALPEAGLVKKATKLNAEEKSESFVDEAGILVMSDEVLVEV